MTLQIQINKLFQKKKNIKNDKDKNINKMVCVCIAFYCVKFNFKLWANITYDYKI